MTALWIILAIALALTLLNLLPVGVDAAYAEGAFSLAARIGPARLHLRRRHRMQSPGRRDPKNRRRKKRRQSLHRRTRRCCSIWRSSACRHSIVCGRSCTCGLLRLVFVSGAPDPYDTALAFGCVNAALGALTPLAERTLCIDERDIQTGVDFDAERPRIDARIVCTIRIGQIVAVALIFGVGYLKQKLQAKKARAARAKTAPDTQERKVSNG